MYTHHGRHAGVYPPWEACWCIYPGLYLPEEVPGRRYTLVYTSQRGSERGGYTLAYTSQRGPERGVYTLVYTSQRGPEGWISWFIPPRGVLRGE